MFSESLTSHKTPFNGHASISSKLLLTTYLEISSFRKNSSYMGTPFLMLKNETHLNWCVPLVSKERKTIFLLPFLGFCSLSTTLSLDVLILVCLLTTASVKHWTSVVDQLQILHCLWVTFVLRVNYPCGNIFFH